MEDLEEEYYRLKEEADYLTEQLNSFKIVDDASLVEGLKLLVRADQAKSDLLKLLKLMKGTDE